MDHTRTSRRITRPIALLPSALVAGILLGISVPALTQEGQPANLQPGPNPRTPKPLQDDNVGPAPASIGTDIPLTYFGPSPSQVQKELLGPTSS